eukprot:TRINITY_DN5020_c0_g1_i1.p1 TRINITY_DN5020_c0_g1~~TRINITY_DN5020_c0_g1_i1.p1  ORF type:complete len:782 (+),score=149.42 TRINITY_DN5020_c0_g1_i1:49-2346(+)
MAACALVSPRTTPRARRDGCQPGVRVEDVRAVFGSLPVRAAMLQRGRFRVQCGVECCGFPDAFARGRPKVHAWVMRVADSALQQLPSDCVAVAEDGTGFTVTLSAERLKECQGCAVHWIAFQAPLVNPLFNDVTKLIQTSTPQLSETLTKKITKFLKVDSVNAVASDGQTLLHFSAYAGNTELSQWLLKKGASLNIQDERGWSPLMCSIGSSNFPCAQVLLAKGAHADQVNMRGHSALHLLAKSKSHDDISLEMMRTLATEYPGLVNLKSYTGETPLLLACMAPFNAKCVELLLEADADPNICDNQEMTPLYRATQSNNVQLVSLLLQHNADIRKTCRGGSCLDFAMEKKYIAVAERLRAELTMTPPPVSLTADPLSKDHPFRFSKHGGGRGGLESPPSSPILSRSSSTVLTGVQHHHHRHSVSIKTQHGEDNACSSFSVMIPTPNNLAPMPACFIPSESTEQGVPYTVIYCYDTRDTLESVMPWLMQLRQNLSANVLSYDYTGYGQHKGESSLTECILNLKCAFEWLINVKAIRGDHIILYGQGLGTTVSLAFAEQHYSVNTDAKSLGAVFAESAMGSSMVKSPGMVLCPVVFIHGEQYDISKMEELAQQYRQWTLVNVLGGKSELNKNFANVYLPLLRNFVRSTLQEPGTTHGLSLVLRQWLQRNELSPAYAEFLAANQLFTMSLLAHYLRGEPIFQGATLSSSVTEPKSEAAKVKKLFKRVTPAAPNQWDKLKKHFSKHRKPLAPRKPIIVLPAWAGVPPAK